MRGAANILGDLDTLRGLEKKITLGQVFLHTQFRNYAGVSPSHQFKDTTE